MNPFSVAHRAKRREDRTASLHALFFRGHLLCSVFLLGLAVVHAAPPLVDNRSSPHARVRSVGLDDVRWTEGFWARHFATARTRTLPAMWALMSGTTPKHYLENFRIAAGLTKGRYRGAPFNDGDFYKWLEGACVVSGLTGDADLGRKVDEAIDIIARAQRPDGYLHTPVLVRARNGDPDAVPFQDRHNFEMYNMGHLMTAACVHHRVTGKTTLLAVAEKAADFLFNAFNGATPEAARSSVCPSHYMGMVELYRTTRDPRHLRLARRFFELRSRVEDGGDDNQDRIPFSRQTTAVGHAVRANYLYAGAADLFMETGDASLWMPLAPIWENLVRKKMYITGGCGALYDGASPDGSSAQQSITRTHQAYGRHYQLPNVTAHCETCANIGNVLWNWRMFLATGEARFVDTLELTLYNSVLSGVSLDGTEFFYVNPLRTVKPLPVKLRWSRTRVPYMTAFCCPPNVARMLAEVGSYAYARSTGTIWVNLYGSSTLSTTLDDGTSVRLTMATEYPWSGRVRLTIDECGPKPFAFKLRIPGWTDRVRVRVNQRPTEIDADPGEYAELRRPWKPGDFVDLDFPMEARLMESHPLVEETFNQIAVRRGPIVYCLESTDLPDDVRVMEVSVPPDIELASRYDSRLLGGVVVLEGTVQARSQGNWTGRLYREVQPTEAKRVELLLVPYYAWGNRGESEMTVWMARAEGVSSSGRPGGK